MLSGSPDLRHGNWRQNLVQSFSVFLPMRPLVLTPSLLHSVLADKTAGKFIWSVCFSPNGKLLATGAEDGVVRVSSRTFIR